MSELHCTHCGSTGLEAGLVQGTGFELGVSRWIAGVGGKLFEPSERPNYAIDTYRCPTCLHIEMFSQPTPLPLGPLDKLERQLDRWGGRLRDRNERARARSRRLRTPRAARRILRPARPGDTEPK
ncbi:hypothetical protein [Nocardia sp. alder85J]|uniref:hypothetical protein n=1 Tax=Nocardia sp. alder85J TaxID=2862949 RepID=UPI001CD2333A|nr:hypothetical protein [Nocardia sp. alder85J]MCX4097251.1 hypothetical protein [Nocardia sp. alder85J]